MGTLWLMGIFVFAVLIGNFKTSLPIFERSWQQIFFKKEAQLQSDFLAHSENITFEVKTAVAYFVKILGYYLFQHLVTLSTRTSEGYFGFISVGQKWAKSYQKQSSYFLSTFGFYRQIDKVRPKRWQSSPKKRFKFYISCLRLDTLVRKRQCTSRYVLLHLCEAFYRYWRPDTPNKVNDQCVSIVPRYTLLKSAESTSKVSLLSLQVGADDIIPVYYTYLLSYSWWVGVRPTHHTGILLGLLGMQYLITGMQYL